MNKNSSIRFIFLFILCLYASSHLLLGQVPDLPNKKVELPDTRSFKSWLSHSWLKNEVTYDTLEQSGGKLYLTLRLECKDNCSSKWYAIKSSFDSISSLPIETYLWHKANFHLENTIPLIVEIYNRPEPFEQPCFLRSIYYKDSIRIATADCKDLGATSYLNYEKFNPSFLMKKLNLPGSDKKAEQILDTLFLKSEKYFKSKGKNVKVIKRFTEPHKITFNVVNLQNEVLKGPKSIEKLEITILCDFHTGRARFMISMNGKSGSYHLKPINDDGYNDLEDDHKADFQLYVNEFANNKILEWLK